MRILILTQYFPPEVGAPQERLSHLARALARRHEVVVITGQPNYPSGFLHDGYTNAPLGLRAEKMFGSVAVLRTWVYLTKGRFGTRHRLLAFLSFALSAFRAWFRAGPADVVFVETPPIFLSFTASVFAWARGARKVVHFADPWVSFAVDHGYLCSGSALAKLAFWLERRSLAMSDLIVVPNKGIQASCDEVHGLHAELVSNGVDTEYYQPDRVTGSAARRALGLDGKFVVVYAGTHQLQANLDVIIDAAATLAPSYPDIHFLLIGHGADKARIRDLAETRGVLGRSVTMADSVTPDRMRDILNGCDVGINPLANSPMTDKTLSVKLLSYMACALPVVIADRKVQTEIVTAAGCGVTYVPGDAGSLAARVAWLYEHAQERAEMGQRGRVFVVENLSRDMMATKLEGMLLRLAGQRATVTADESSHG